MLAIIITACSKENDTTVDHLLFTDIAGIWYIDIIIQTDGTLEDYVHASITERDYTEFYSPNSQTEVLHIYTCTDTYEWASCTNFYISGFEVKQCNSKYNGLDILSDNKNTLTIEYYEVEYFPFPENNIENAKGIILTRN